MDSRTQLVNSIQEDIKTLLQDINNKLIEIKKFSYFIKNSKGISDFIEKTKNTNPSHTDDEIVDEVSIDYEKEDAANNLNYLCILDEKNYHNLAKLIIELAEKLEKNFDLNLNVMLVSNENKLKEQLKSIEEAKPLDEKSKDKKTLQNADIELKKALKLIWELKEKINTLSRIKKYLEQVKANTPNEYKFASSQPADLKSDAARLRSTQELLSYEELSIVTHRKSFIADDKEQKDLWAQSAPKKIHYVWLGGPLPKKYLQQMLLVTAHSPGYEVYLWSDNANVLKKAEIDDIELPLKNFTKKIIIRPIAELYSLIKQKCTKATYDSILDIAEKEGVGFKNLAAKSDILRLFILYFEGGIYLDTDIQYDIENSKNLDDVKPLYGLVHTKGNNCIIATLPEHPILHLAINNIINTYKKLENLYEYNHQKDTLQLKRNPANYDHRRNYTILLTGPDALVNAVKKYAKTHVKPCDEQTHQLFTLENSDSGTANALKALKPTCDNTWLERNDFDLLVLPEHKHMPSDLELKDLLRQHKFKPFLIKHNDRIWIYGFTPTASSGHAWALTELNSKIVIPEKISFSHDKPIGIWDIPKLIRSESNSFEAFNERGILSEQIESFLEAIIKIKAHVMVPRKRYAFDTQDLPATKTRMFGNHQKPSARPSLDAAGAPIPPAPDIPPKKP